MKIAKQHNNNNDAKKGILTRNLAKFFGYVDCALGWIYKLGNRQRSFFLGAGHVVFLCRVSLIVILVTAALLWIMPQGHEIGYAVSDGFWLFYGSVFFCSILAWLWARVILNHEFNRPLDGKKPVGAESTTNSVMAASGVPRERLGFWIKTIPRVIGVLPAGGAAFAIFIANRQTNWVTPGWEHFAAAVAMVIGVFVMVVWRRDFTSWITRTFAEKPIASKKIDGLFSPKSTEEGTYASLSAGMKVSLYLGFLVPLLVLLVGLWIPARLGLYLGASASVFIPAAFAVSFLSFFVFVFNAHKKQRETDTGQKAYNFPVLTAAALASVVLPYFFDVDRYAIRSLGANAILNEDGRPLVRQAVEQWFDQQAQEGKMTPDLVIVATAGGALRAAMWTGTILGKLLDEVPGFQNKLFAISGVSGGSLGATAYMAAVREGKPGDCVSKLFENRVVAGSYECRIQNGLKGDFLGPVMLGLISNDTFMIGLGGPFRTKDRAEALEEAWELVWQRSQIGAGKSNPFAANFLDLWDKGENFPALFLNGTHQELGSRVITGNLSVKSYKPEDKPDDPLQQDFREAYDFFDLRNNPIAASTAVHNSARFSYVSPVGKIKKDNHIIDGGYFENYGAETAVELVKLIRDVQARKGNKVKPIVHIVQIVSDPALSVAAFNATDVVDGKISNRNPKSMFLGQKTGPVQGLLQTRESRGMNAAKRLRASVPANRFYLFNMGTNTNDRGPALSWFMPGEVAEKLICQLRKDAGQCKGTTPDRANYETFTALKNNLSKPADQKGE